jgi:hypothetical protein
MVHFQMQLMLSVVWQEIYNDYESFCLQNLMVEYVHAGQNSRPIKRTPFAPSCEEWAVLANETHDIEPTNLTR